VNTRPQNIAQHASSNRVMAVGVGPPA
jgi:hypothetical protein